MPAAHGRFGQQDFLGFFPSHLSLFERNMWKSEVKDGRGTEKRKQQDQRASTSCLLSASCLCCLSCLHLPQSYPKGPRDDGTHLFQLLLQSQALFLDVLLSLVPPLPSGLRHPAIEAGVSRGGAGQEPQPGHPRAPKPWPHFSSGLFPALLQKHRWDHLPSPLEGLFTSPNSDLNYEILR